MPIRRNGDIVEPTPSRCGKGHSETPSPMATISRTLPPWPFARPAAARCRPSSRWTSCAPPMRARRRASASSISRSASPARRRRRRCWRRRGGRALAAPGYPAYRNILAALGLEPVLIEVGENAHYQPNPELLSAYPDLKGLVVASPANPTGTMIAPAELRRLYDYCAGRGIRLVSDEIYHGITYEVPAETARACGRDAIVVNSFSKYYSMTGWRLGWMLVPPDLARSVECLA